MFRFLFQRKKDMFILHLKKNFFLSIENHTDVLEFIHNKWTKHKKHFSDY